jgi:hypothetical protein
MDETTPIQTEGKRTHKVAYMMTQGQRNCYEAYRLELDGNTIVKREMIGNPDLKAVVFGRLLKLLFVMR